MSKIQCPREVTMNVDSSQWAAAFDDPECFFTQELGTAIHYVETLAGSARKARETGASESHEAGPIAVFGRRGAGKSSFLKALAKKLEAAHPEDGRILCLEVLEPNRIEKHEVFLATVVALILQKLDSVKPDSFRGPHASKDSEGALGKVRDALQDLTSYFNVLVPKESLSKRDPNESSISFAQRVLADSRAGLRLPKAFHRFLNAAAEVLRTDAILLMIDDTDVAHDRCVDVLETVRKYLCTPRLITVVAADLELLELQIARDSVRWGTELQELEALFGETASNLEGAVTKRHRAQAYALQEQYLSKVLPEHRRVRIPSVARKLREGAVRLLLTKGDQETQLVVCRESAKDSKVDALQEFCTVLGIPRIDAVEYLPVGSRL